ncbi:DUF3301 domain-containing protein [Pseudomonas sp. PS02288]|uniref:DUF3301 domain-containing protein n=1 Tax=Pseudomonas sp. PS02288 TaxID=2991443 RepID=UPI00249CBB7F|nr:DUF3301 domain-containing protein [Pseudomonas sp. PS02288]
MLTLGNLFLLLLLAGAGAWLWHGHGVRERALILARQHCAKVQVELLDENVAFRRFGLLADSRGRKRFARVYAFEFTVTGEQRHAGTLVMFGNHLGRIELEAHPLPSAAEPPPAPVVEVAASVILESVPSAPATPRRTDNVVRIDQWKRKS